MISAEVSHIDGYVTVAMHIYPGATLSDPMCKLSEGGKAFVVPNDLNPNSPWIWKFQLEFESAVKKLLTQHGFGFNTVGVYEQTRLGRILP